MYMISKKNKKLILFSLLLTFLLVAGFSTKSYAEGLYNMAVSARVQPHYEIVASGDNLYVTTNMKVFVNGKQSNN